MVARDLSLGACTFDLRPLRHRVSGRMHSTIPVKQAKCFMLGEILFKRGSKSCNAPSRRESDAINNWLGTCVPLVVESESKVLVVEPKHTARGSGYCGIKGYFFDVQFMIRLALFSGHLRDIRNSATAIADGWKLCFGEETVPAFQVWQENKCKFPDKAIIQNAWIRFDLTCILYQRHLFRSSLLH